MKKVLFLIIFATIPLFSFSQLLKTEDVEKRWKTLYTNGMQSIRDGNYSDAESFLLQGADFLKQNDAFNSNSYLTDIIQLGILYKTINNESKYIEVVNEIEHFGNSIRPGSKRELNYFYSVGVFYSEVGSFQKSLDYLSKALKVDAIGNSEEMQAKCLHRKALALYFQDDIEQAIRLQEKAIALDRNKTPIYHKALVHYYFMAKEWSKLDNEISVCFDYCRESILRQFTRSKAKSRTAYWNTSNLFFTKSIPYYLSINQSNQMVVSAYNAVLFSKGILLTATTKSANLIIDSSNQEMVKAYNDYLSLKGNKSRTIEQDFELQALEDVIVRYQKDHKEEYRKDFRIGWKDIKKQLRPYDVAIEFITYPDEEGNDNYGALVLKSNYEVPKFVPLFNYKQLVEVSPNDYYTTSELYNYIWTPLESEIEDVENIYFSPAGVLYKIGIEYLPDFSGISPFMNHNVYRLSSTKELVLAHKGSIQKAALFGGINYNTSVVELAKQSPKYNTDVQENRAISLDSLDLRNVNNTDGFSFLQGTIEEVGEISTELLSCDIDAELYTGEYGSETNLKNLTDNEFDLLHIATHGFYYSNNLKSRNISLDKLFRDINLHDISEDIELIDEEKMMTRSGLILAGANNLLRKVSIPKGIEDGILYADEISALNFSSVDLLVLSACQSGQGDIASSEGVFGLQRGFKVAGVKSIIMSLWKVNDTATRLLMTEMYKNLLTGQEIREAFVNAQMSLRTFENGLFDKPEFWAAFILLDGIN